MFGPLLPMMCFTQIDRLQFPWSHSSIKVEIVTFHLLQKNIMCKVVSCEAELVKRFFNIRLTLTLIACALFKGLVANQISINKLRFGIIVTIGGKM